MRHYKFELPFPPTVNSYWGNSSRGHKYLKKKAKEYRQEVLLLLSKEEYTTIDTDVHAIVRLYPPCKRKRDIDNYLKGLFDALTHAKVYEDDAQITSMYVDKRSKFKGGKVEVEIIEKGTKNGYKEI